MSKSNFKLLSPIFLFLISCNINNEPDTSAENIFVKGSFGYDLNFLRQHDSVAILEANDGKSKVIVSPKYQSKVFTSTANGDTGKSFGWINYKAFGGTEDKHMNAYGGENRFWLGPEGGVYSLFFSKGSEMTFDNWKTPAPFDSEAWKVVSKNKESIHLQKDMKLENYKGTKLSLKADRIISILNKNKIGQKTGMQLTDSINAVGYLAENTVTNTGEKEWDEKTGMPCIWMLDMLNPSPDITIVIPHKEAADTGAKVATTNYFGQIPPNRIKYNNGVLYFKADGKSRGKLGVNPLHAKPEAGSWDAANGILTVIIFDIDSSGKYLNQEWNANKPPFSGDAVNAYNDGPLDNGTQMGPFYELESVSPAAFLKPGASLTHNHYVFHFTGGREQLDKISEKIFGVSLSEIENTFKKS